MPSTYALVNPMVVGTMKTTVEAPNSATAAVELYNRLSPYFASVQPNLIFTIQKVKEGGQLGGGNAASYQSFIVREVDKGGEVTYTIGTYTGNLKLANLKSSISRVQQRLANKTDLLDSEKAPSKQSGGRRKHKYDDDDDDDEDVSEFDRILDEIEESDRKIFPRKKSYITELALPVLIDPIQYYWYTPIIYDVPKIIVPNFISTISPRIIISLD
jgi:hypothetical protein